jgi:hypothetical protein
MKTVILELETPGGALFARQIFGSAKDVSLPGGAVLTLDGVMERKAFDFPSLMTFVLTIPADIMTGVVAAWLYDTLKGRARVIRIDRTEITLDKGEIQKILTEKITLKE